LAWVFVKGAELCKYHVQLPASAPSGLPPR